VDCYATGLFYQEKDTKRFYFIVTSDCGITAECSVNKLVNTAAAHVCAFCETKSLYKNKSVRLTDFFVAQTVTVGEQKISSKSDIFLKNFYPLRLL